MTNKKLKSEQIKNFLKDFWWKFLLLIAIWYICYAMKITLSQEHLFWTFSTVMQSFVALGALLGMVAVFKLQVIDNNVENVSSVLSRNMGILKGDPSAVFLPEDVLREAKKILKDKRKALNQSDIVIHTNKIEIGIAQLKKLFNEEKNIKKQIIDFVWKIVVITALALMFLIITPLLIKMYAGIASLGLILYLAISSLIATIKLIKEIL